MNKLILRAVALGAFCVAAFTLTSCGSYNRLIALNQNVDKKWADVQSVYQRRADLIPNLVNTVQGAANFEKSTLTDVINARASVGQVKIDPTKAPTDPQQLAQFQQAQGALSSALSRLLVVAERYRNCVRRRLSKICRCSSRERRIESTLNETTSTARCRSTTRRCKRFRP